MGKNYYKVLGLEKSASKDDIKKAFRKLAQQHHPDKGGDEAKFKGINEAYQVLSNDSKRAEYDTYGQTFSGSGGPRGGFSAGGGPGSGWDFSGMGGFGRNAGVEFDVDLGEMFSDFFSGRRSGGAGQRRGRDVSIDIEISFKEAVFGTTRNVVITKVNACSECAGTGAKAGTEMIKCSTCAGRGVVKESRSTFFGSFVAESVCKSCDGRGQRPKETCGKCKGEGIKTGGEEINISIPAGIDNGEMIRLTGRGEAVRAGVSGDLYVKVHVEPHKTFTRQGVDLIMDLPVKLSDAILDAKYQVETLDGPVELSVPEGTTHGTVVKIPGKGVLSAKSSKRGDILAKVSLKLPSRLSTKARKLINELREEGI